MYVRTGLSGFRGLSGGDAVITALSQINQAAYNYAYQQYIKQGIDPASAKLAAVQAAYNLTLQRAHEEPFVEEGIAQAGGVSLPGNPITSTGLATAAQNAWWPMCPLNGQGYDAPVTGIPCRSQYNPDPLANAQGPATPGPGYSVNAATTQLTADDQAALSQYIAYMGAASTGAANPSASYNPAQTGPTSYAAWQLPNYTGTVYDPNYVAPVVAPAVVGAVQSSAGPTTTQPAQPGSVQSTLAYDTQQLTPTQQAAIQQGTYSYSSYYPSAAPSTVAAPVASSTAVSGAASTTAGPLDSVMAWVSANPLIAAGGALALFFVVGGMGGKR